MERPTINDLPNELLELIFDHLDLDDLKNASLVCRRWSDTAFSGRRMERVVLMPKFPWDNDFVQSKRKYRHLDLGDIEKCPAHVKELFQPFNVSTLRTGDFYLSHSSLRLILLEAPNLQHLSIVYEPVDMNEIIEPLPVMRKLKRLEIEDGDPEGLCLGLPWHSIAPSLLSLKMYCDSENKLEQWRLFSGQLKQVYVTCYDGNSFKSLKRFCEMTFPLLEELSIKAIASYDSCQHDLFTRHDFFQRNTSLRRFRLDNIYLSKTLVQDITNHTKQLASLEIIGFPHLYEGQGESGAFESLAQLTELKHLGLENLNSLIFLGCGVLTSLQCLYINSKMICDEFFKDLFKIAPQLRCLELGSSWVGEMDIQFICNNFSQLTRLQLLYLDELSHNCLSGIDRLLHFWYLECNLCESNRFFISNIPQNNVRCLTLHLPNEYNENDLLRLPEIFPILDRLNLINFGEFLHESTVDKLHQLLPTCAIKIYGYLIANTGVEKCFPRWTRSEMMPVWEKEWVWKNPEI